MTEIAFNPVIYIVVVVLCLVISAFFSSGETALLRISSHQIQEDLKKKVFPAVAAVKELLQSLSKLLITLLMGNTIVNILATAAASAVCVYYFGNEAGVVIATVAMTILVLLFGELLPKAVAAKRPKQVAYFLALPLYFFHKILSPLHYLFEKIIDPIVDKLAGGADQEHRQAYDSILMLARQMKEQTRRLTDHGSALPIIGSTARAAETTAEEIMVPKIEIFACEYNIKASELLTRMLQERYTRVPIYKDNLDNFLGLIHLKDLITHVQQGREDIAPILKPILKIPERRLIFSILAEMQKAFIHVAIVKDQYGGTRGLLTQEDILEEMVGEIRDEFDKDELMSIQKIGEHTYSVLGRVPVHDFNRETGLHIASEKGDTLGGIVFNSVGRAPRLGDVATIGDYQVSVSDLSGNRITRVIVNLKAASEVISNSPNPAILPTKD